MRNKEGLICGRKKGRENVDK
jgi:hypothetical protein